MSLAQVARRILVGRAGAVDDAALMVGSNDRGTGQAMRLNGDVGLI